MFKLGVKLAVLTLLFLGVATCLSSGSKVEAVNGCPNSFMDAQNNMNWGVNTGGHTGDMAGLIIHAYDASNNRELQTTYHLRSAISNQDPNPGETPNGTSVDLNDRIFANFNGLPAGFENDPTNRTHDYASSTVPNLFGGCNGWDAFGPANLGGYTGNGRVLDCGPAGNATRFWFTNLRPTPAGNDGANGYWSINIYNQGGGVIKKIDHYTEGSMNFGNGFNVSNGSNTFVNMIWHPQTPPPQPGGSSVGTNTCQYLRVEEVAGNTRTRTWVSVTGVTVGRVKYTHDTNTKWWPSQNSIFNPRPQDISTWVGPGSGNDPPDQPDVTGAPAWDGENNMTVSKEWWFQPNANSITVSYRTDVWHPATTTTAGYWANGTPNSTTTDCFKANTCVNPLTITGDGPSNIVLANGVIHVSGTYQNTGLLPLWYPSVTASDGNSYPVQINGPTLDPGGTGTFSFTMDAPSSIQYYPLSVTPVYFGAMTTGSCSASVPIYQKFDIQPRATLPSTNDWENPTTVNFTGGGYLRIGVSRASATHTTLTKNGVEVKAQDDTPTYGDIDLPYSYGYSPIIAGDEFCAHVKINPASGYQGPSNVVEPHEASAHSGCETVVNRPYAHFFGNDVTAGGGFGKSCQKNQKGVIYTYNNTPGGAVNSANKGGAGAQFGAQAMDIISGLGSASLRSSAPTGLSGLSFANTEHIGGTDPSKTTGGYLGDAGLSNFCVPDYFSDKPALLSSNPDVALTESTNTSATAGAGNAKQWYKPSGGTLTLNSGTIPNGFNQAIFVEGNVNITGDIKYSTAARGSVKDIPSFYLVVKNGNIRIDPSVKQLDGVYVAQPNTSNSTELNKTGIINTCWVANSTNDIYNNCKNQLVINGAFVANRVMLARSYSSLRFSQSGEHNMGGFAAHNCGIVNKDVPAGSTSASDCAAEIFNFSPELYMSQPSVNARYGAPSGKFDAITSLSPVL